MKYLIERFPFRFIPAIALICPLLLSQAYAASKLARIEFKPDSSVTEIQLQAETVLPYNVVYSSPSKTIVDIEDVASEDTIDTRFTGDSTISSISNVVIQPLDSHSLRLIIKGEHLGTPKISFLPIRSAEATLASQTLSESKASQKQNANLIPESFGDEPNASITASPVVAKAPKKPAINQKGIANELDNALTPMAQADIKPPKEENLASSLETILTSPLKQSGIEKNLKTIWGLAPYGLIGLLIIGLGIFLRKKLTGLGQAKSSHNEFETLLQQQGQDQPVNFQQLAEAYRNSANLESPEFQALSQGPNATPKADNLIGLGALSQILSSQKTGLPSAQLNLQEQLGDLLPQEARNIPKASARQAINQYANSQRPSLPPKNNSLAAKKRSLSPEKAGQELQNALNARQETKQQLREQHVKAVTSGALKPGSPYTQSPAHKQALQQRQNANQFQNGKNQANNGGNPEVLNFLRDVADLMEKDGNATMAKSFRKGINPAQ